MGIFDSEAKKRLANLCHLLYSGVTDKDLIENYGFSEEEIAEGKEKVPYFDDFVYCRKGKIVFKRHKK